MNHSQRHDMTSRTQCVCALEVHGVVRKRARDVVDDQRLQELGANGLSSHETIRIIIIIVIEHSLRDFVH